MAITCTSCGTVLATHCDSKQCHWMRCDNRACVWWVYDLEHGARSTLNGTVERMGQTPEPETDQA